jgi:hypothetical protein
MAICGNFARESGELKTALATGSRAADKPEASAQCRSLCSVTARAVRYYSRKTGRLAPLR